MISSLGQAIVINSIRATKGFLQFQISEVARVMKIHLKFKIVLIGSSKIRIQGQLNHKCNQLLTFLILNLNQ